MYAAELLRRVAEGRDTPLLFVGNILQNGGNLEAMLHLLLLTVVLRIPVTPGERSGCAKVTSSQKRRQ